MDTLVLANQQKIINFSSVQTLDAVWTTYQERWSIGVDSEIEPKESVLSIVDDDDDDDGFSLTDFLLSDTWADFFF